MKMLNTHARRAGGADHGGRRLHELFRHRRYQRLPARTRRPCRQGRPRQDRLGPADEPQDRQAGAGRRGLRDPARHGAGRHAGNGHQGHAAPRRRARHLQVPGDIRHGPDAGNFRSAPRSRARPARSRTSSSSRRSHEPRRARMRRRRVDRGGRCGARRRQRSPPRKVPRRSIIRIRTESRTTRRRRRRLPTDATISPFRPTPDAGSDKAAPASASRAADRKIKFYRNPMGLPDTSPVPKKDSMGMDYIAVYDGDDADDGAVRLSPGKIQRCGVKSEPATRRVIPHRDPRARHHPARRAAGFRDLDAVGEFYSQTSPMSPRVRTSPRASA